jgi:hypothetical protein
VLVLAGFATEPVYAGCKLRATSASSSVVCRHSRLQSTHWFLRAAAILSVIDSSSFWTSSHAAKMSKSLLSSARSTIPRRRLSDFLRLCETILKIPGAAVRHEHASGLEAPPGARARGPHSRGREAQWRPCRIEASPVKQVAEWTDGYRHIWEARLDRLEGYLQTLKAKEKTCP